MLRYALVASAVLGAAGFAFSAPAQALTMKECSVKYNDAKTAGTLGKLTWNEFRKSQCGTDAAAAPEEDDAPTMAPQTGTATAGGVVFPRTVSAKYSSEKPGKARMKTCLDQYNANKDRGAGNGSLKWIQKGGGYYSQCNTRLKS